MRKTGNLRKLVSAFLAGMTLLSAVLSPMPAYAAEPERNTIPPCLEEIQDQLDEDEVVRASDFEMIVGTTFDVKVDFSGLEIKDDKKVKVSFVEAKNEEGQDFTTDHADSYKAVYYVEPANTAHPIYQISRNLIVKEASVSVQTEETTGSVSSGDGESQDAGEEEADGEDGESDIQVVTDPERFDVMAEEIMNQDTYDEESGLELHDVLEQAEEKDLELSAMEAGESMIFAAAPKLASATGSQNVTITKGTKYYYSDYGLGTYLTEPYYISYGNVNATAYCIQPAKPGPGSGTYTITRIADNQALAKVCYYGTDAAGSESYFAKHHTDFSAGKRFIITHMAAAYAYGDGSAFYGTNSTGQALAMELYNYCTGKPAIPSVAMSFSNSNVKAYIDGSGQRTEEITFHADSQQSITMQLPSGVKLHNITTGTTSAAGANVKITGGTKFYLSAPLTQAEDVKGSWSATMQGSITKDYSAYKLTTGGDVQDLAFVFGEGVEDEQYVDFNVEWVKMATIEIVKKDAGSHANVAGAVYGIYSDEAGQHLIAKMPATDKNGASSITIEKTQDTVYLKEISVPNGYVLDAKSYGINLVIGGTTKKDVTNKEQFADLTVYKEGEVLTGATITDSGVTFQYTKQRLKGAVYSVYAGADIKAADGTVVFKKGDLVKDGLTTGDDGSAVLKNLHLGTYVVTETQAPANYVCKGESKTVTLSYAGQNVEVAVGNVTFENDRQKARVTVEKLDDTTKNPLDGGIFGLYAAEDIADASGHVVVNQDTLLAKATTGEDGSAVFETDLPINHKYYVKELQAPENYYRNTEDVFTFEFKYTNDQQASVAFTHTFENERVDATIHLVKKDKETGSIPQGDATFEGAVYGLYAREDIVHPDGKTGVLYPAGSQVASLTTDEKGNASVENLYLGKYYIKEITPPTGYLLDENEYDLDCSYEGDLVKTVERSTESQEQVMKQPFQVIKVANDGNTDAELLKGAGFTAYLKSSLRTDPDGSYDYAFAKPVVLTEDGKTEMFTDEKGYACSIPLPYGTYIMRETTTPHNYKPVKDFIVTISENHPDEPQIWRILLDEEFKAKLKIIKKDDETKQTVLIAGTEFKIYDLDNQKYVEQVTTYPITTVHKSYFTDSQGYLILPNNLPIGHYRIEEVTAPDGYVLNPNYVEVTVDSNTAYHVDSVSQDVVIEVEYENHPVKGKLTVYKKGEVLTDFKKDFIYEEQYLEGAVFEVYAAEDIYTPDFQKDADGNRMVVYAKDTLVTTITTDEEGKATAEDLPLGTYRVVEKTAPNGFILNKEPEEATFVYLDQETPIVEQEITMKNERQKVQIMVEKQDAETGVVVEGAVFGIYNKEDIKAEGKTLVKADTLLQEMTSDENGLASCTLDLPLGSYYVKELQAPDGFISSDEVLSFDASYQGQEVEKVSLKSVKKNQPTTVEITKSDLTTGEELDGASLKVLDRDGNVVDEWTSVKGEPHVIKRLVVGETYILREEFAPYGYLKTTDVEFTIEDTGEVQRVEMKDDVPTGLLIINKKGEFLDKVTVLDHVKGTIEHFFEYITGNLQDVTFEVYAAEDIKAADGVSEDYYKADELVGTITTDTNGIAQMKDLPVGKYYVKEVATAHGYVLDEEPRYIDLSYLDQDTPVVTFENEWQNSRQKVKVTVLKKEKDTDRALAGGIFGLFTKDEIKNAKGDVLMEADSLIELKTTDENGQIQFVADLPVDGNYCVKEIYAPPGFVTTNEEQDFTFEYAGAEQEEVGYDFTFENEATIVELKKSDLTTGEELPGAHLKVTDEDGNVVDEWVSTEEAYVIKELEVGKSYTMTETKPADGFVTAESITFTIENTAEIQKHEMKDDVTKVQISKTDITGEQEIPGAKLTILDENEQVIESWTSTEEPHYIEKLPIGTYILREEQAPKGFLLTADVPFEVKDTGEIQKVIMKDDTAKGKVILNKTDQETGEPLKGVEFELRDSDGKVLETLKTDAAGHAESGFYEIADYKDGKYETEKKYYLVETKTLEGYTLDSTEHEVAFTYKDDHTPIVEVTFDLTNEKPVVPETPEESNPKVDSPKTGDDTNLWLPVLCMAVSAGGVTAILMRRKKKNRK